MTKSLGKKTDDPFLPPVLQGAWVLGASLRQTPEQSGGGLEVTSEPGKDFIIGTFSIRSYRQPPLGDIPNAVVLMVSANPLVDFEYKYSYNGKSYEIDTFQLKEVLGDTPLSDLHVMGMIEEMIKTNQTDLKVCQIQ